MDFLSAAVFCRFRMPLGVHWWFNSIAETRTIPFSACSSPQPNDISTQKKDEQHYLISYSFVLGKSRGEAGAINCRRIIQMASRKEARTEHGEMDRNVDRPTGSRWKRIAVAQFCDWGLPENFEGRSLLAPSCFVTWCEQRIPLDGDHEVVFASWVCLVIWVE